MSGERLNVSIGAAAAAVVALVLGGSGVTYLLMRGSSEGRSNAVGSRASEAPAPSSAERPPAVTFEVVVSLTKDAVDRAGIRVAPVSMQSAEDTLRLPGVVEPNAYRQVAVTPLVGGRIVRVSAQLGDRVRRGQSVAWVYSPELSDARAKYVAATAMLDAHDRELQRTQKLVAIGAASRQELERIHAEHAAQIAEVDSARSRLELLGGDAGKRAPSAPDENATTSIPAPIDGVVTERLANVGLNVDPTTKLFTVIDLSNVWIIGDVYERDLHRVREGARATVTTNAYPDLALDGRVSYIDPQLDTTTRTAKVRVEVPNPRGVLRLGMFTDVAITSSRTPPVLSVPNGAIQNVGDRQVVYAALSDGASTFVERGVRVGRSLGDRVEILAGLAAGDLVVSKGSFFVRAEAERLGLRGSQAAVSQTAKILIDDKGFQPSKVRLRAGIPAHLIFVRTTDETCAKEIVFPSMNVKRTLPLNEAVAIEFTPVRTGDIAFSCGMNMLHGTVVVQ